MSEKLSCDADKKFGVEIISSLISTGLLNLNTFDKDGLLPLHVAARNHQNLLVDLILENGADVDARSKNGKTALDMAISLCLPDVVKILLEHNASLEDINEHGKSALWVVLNLYKPHQEILDSILQHGENSTNNLLSNYYELCRAIVNNDSRTAERVIDQSEDVDFSDIDTESPLEFAIQLERLEIARLLLEKNANPNESLNRKSVLVSAINSQNLVMIKLLLNFNVNVNFVSAFSDYYYWFEDTPLSRAARHSDKFGFELLKQLLNYGVDQASKNLALLVASSEGFLDGVMLLLHNSADVNSLDDDKNTPLHRGAKHPEILEYLLESGAQVNAKNIRGQTALHVACIDSNLKCIKILLQFGADPAIMDKSGRTILHCATRNDIYSSFQYTINVIADQELVSVNKQDLNGDTPLHYTLNAKHSCAKYVQLLKNGADPNIQSRDGKYPCHECHNNKKNKMCSVSEYLERLEFLGLEIESDQPDYEDSFPSELYEIEVEELQRHFIAWNPLVSLYDVLFMNRPHMTRYSDNENLREAFINCGENFEFVYPHFGGILNTQYRRGLRRKNFKKLMEEHLENVFGRRVPHICSDLITKYLSDPDLRDICKSVEI